MPSRPVPNTSPDPTRDPAHDTAHDPAQTALAAVIVLAAGAGTRMRSRTPKVLHPLAGRPLLWHALAAAARLVPEHLVAVLGHGREDITAFLATETGLPPVFVALQTEQLGTGHATACGLAALPSAPTGTVLVTYGDVPLLTAATLRRLTDEHTAGGNAVTVLTAHVEDPGGYGRIVRGPGGDVEAIVEHRDANAEQRRITEINSGVYAFDARVLADALPRLRAANDQGEQYLTDVLALARSAGGRVGALVADDPVETEGINDRVQLSRMAKVLNDRIVTAHQLAGVTVLDPHTTWIHADVTIGADTVLQPNTQLEAGTVIGTGCRIGPDVTLAGCRVGDEASVVRAHCTDSQIGPEAVVGPYALLRAQTVLAAGAKVGTFVEVKNSRIGEGTKVPHQTYLGDTSVGDGTNIGAGVVTANYDGVDKFPTRIGAHAFVGSNVTIVAPVELADGSYVATGSTITDDVPAGALAVARGRQYVSDGWVLRRRAGTRLEQAARSAGAHDRRPADTTGTPEPGHAADDRSDEGNPHA